jgi:ketosteroid isomerase-like protein
MTVQDTNFTVVRRVLEAFDRAEMTAIVEQTDPAIVVDWSRSAGPEAGVYRGRAEASRFLTTFRDAFGRVVSEPRALLECGDSVVVPTRTRMWGRDGVQVQARHVALVGLRDGRVATWRLCLDHREALEALESQSPPRWSQNVEVVRHAMDAFSRGDQALAEVGLQDG